MKGKNEDRRNIEPKEGIKQRTKQDEKSDVTIGKLIQIIDDPHSGWKSLSRLERIKGKIPQLSWMTMTLFYLGILAYAVMGLFPAIEKPEALLSIVIALTALILQLTHLFNELAKPEAREERTRVTTDWNFKRIKEKVESEHWLLLKALIRMRTLQENHKLSEVHGKYPSLFDEENLVITLYDLPH